MLSKDAVKALIKEKSKESNLPPQQLYGLYAMERLILKLSDSTYSDDLIVKGGFLLTTSLGMNSRATRDIDFTIRNLFLTKDVMNGLIDVIESNPENNEEFFKLKSINDIRSDFEYDGYSLKLDYINEKMRIPITVDVTTGEKLVSINDRKKFKSIFTNEEYSLSSYTIEQIVVDKFYTLLAYGSQDDQNSRMKDYYDLYLINKLESDINYTLINKGLSKIMKQRDNVIPTKRYGKIINYLHSSDYQRNLWKSYSRKTPYANDLSFDDVMMEIGLVSKKIIKNRSSLKNKENEVGR